MWKFTELMWSKGGMVQNGLNPLEIISCRQLGKWLCNLGVATTLIFLLSSPSAHAGTGDQIGFNSALESLSRGDYDQSIFRFSRLLTESGRDLQRPVRIKALMGRSEALQALGKYELAIRDLRSAQTILQPSDPPRLAAGISGALGTAYWFSGDLANASRLLDRCLLFAKKTGDNALLNSTYNNKANILSDRGELGAALIAFDEAIKHAREMNDDSGIVSAQLNKAHILLNLKRPLDAEAAVSSGLDLIENFKHPHDKAFALLWTARLIREIRFAGHSPKNLSATPIVKAALRYAQRAGDKRLQADALGEMALLRSEVNDYEAALSFARRGLFLAQSVGATELGFRLHWRVGKILSAQNEIEAAIRAYRLALTTLETVRRDLSTLYRPGRTTFREALGDLYLELAGLLLTMAGESESSDVSASYALQARRVAERLKRADLQDYFGDECVAQLESTAVEIDESLSDEAILYPIVLRDRLELLVSVKGGLRRFVVDVPRDKLEEQAHIFRRMLEKRTTRQYIRPAQILYKWLVSPVESWLQSKNIKTLIFVPDGLLRSIPLAALHDGTRFLIEKYSVAISPGVTLINPKAFPKDQIRLLAAGVSNSVQGYSALPFARDELSVLGRLFGGVTLLDDEFSTAALEKVLVKEPFTVVHIASHAKFEKNVSSSFLLTNSGKLSFDELERLLHFSRFRREPIELLTLSACQTAAGDDRSALGLAGVGIKAGARSVLGSLWFVNDQATSDLILEFYRGLTVAATKAYALRDAQLKLLSQSRYRHPYYWSSFILVGNWL